MYLARVRLGGWLGVLVVLVALAASAGCGGGDMGVAPPCPPPTTVSYADAGPDLRTESFEKTVEVLESLNGTWRGTIDRDLAGKPTYREMLITLQGLDRSRVEIVNGYSQPAEPACNLGDGSTTGTVSVSGVDGGLDAQQVTCATTLFPRDGQVSLACYFDASYRPGTTTIVLQLQAGVDGAIGGDFVFVEDPVHVSGDEYFRWILTLHLLDLAKVAP